MVCTLDQFPASDTDVVNNTMQVRYYSGKDFNKLAEDKQLNADGSFTTWNSVMGAAAGTDKDVVQTDFSPISMILLQRRNSESSIIPGMTT